MAEVLTSSPGLTFAPIFRKVRPADRVHLAALVEQAQDGKLDRSGVLSLFMLCRGDAPDNSVLRDIGHSVAHEERDRGVGWTYIDTFVDHVQSTLVEGGTLQVLIMYPLNDVIDELVSLLNKLRLPVDATRLRAAWHPLGLQLAGLLDGTTFKRRGAEVSLVAAPYPAVSVRWLAPIKGSYPLPPNQSVRFPLLWDPSSPEAIALEETSN